MVVFHENEIDLMMIEIECSPRHRGLQQDLKPKEAHRRRLPMAQCSQNTAIAWMALTQMPSGVRIQGEKGM
jgi:hypothetical protein